MALYYLNDVLLPLSHMLGEESIPSPVPASRVDAVQYAINRILRLKQFDFEKTRITVVLTNGVGVLPASVRVDAESDVRVPVVGVNNDLVLQYVEPEDFDQYTIGDLKYTYLFDTGLGQQSIQVTETNQGSIQLTTSESNPVLSATTGIYFPYPEVIAMAALVFLRSWEDKDADITVEEARFLQAFQEMQATEDRSKGSKRAMTRQEKLGHYTGEVREDPYTTSVFYS